ncbi:hypothetical protein GQ44DRAFT_711175 [Phaeosphaeriaceae sp. PMI808]|nr:hypothetical protein GQ44DRAFT_711175 [Phaeosphaeriaceae sp. PMI808]
MVPRQGARESAVKSPPIKPKVWQLELDAQASCQRICKSLYSKLPRELRDTIYEDIVEPDNVYAGIQYLENRGNPSEESRDAHYWDTKYVGETVRVELIQTWYRVSMFYFWDRKKNDEIIDKFFSFDRWGMGLKPHEYLSRVRFDLGDEILHNGSCRSAYGGECVPKEYPAILTSHLKRMAQFCFPNRVQFLIRIHTYGSLRLGCLQGARLEETLKEILDNFMVLYSAGHRFTVQWSEIENLEFSSGYGTLSVEAWKAGIEMALCRMQY